jgi:hypothetical protein
LIKPQKNKQNLSIAGGKFWDGFRQGIITSGLNHAMHGIIGVTPNKLEKELRKVFGDTSREANINSEEDLINFIKRVPTLKKFYSKFVMKWGNKFELFLSKQKYSSKGGHADTIFPEEKNGVRIYFYRASLSSISWLGEVVLHEFGHSNSAYHGFFYENKNKYGKYSETPEWIDEIYAHKFAYHHGGVSYQTKYYYDFVKFLKNRAVPINAEELTLPSYD